MKKENNYDNNKNIRPNYDPAKKPDPLTVGAIKELEAGKGIKSNSVEEFLNESGIKNNSVDNFIANLEFNAKRNHFLL